MTDLLSKTKENGVYQSTFKVVFLSVFEVVSAFLMSFYFRQLANNSGLSNGRMTLFLVFLGLFAGFSFLTALFVKELQWSGLAAGLSVMASMAVFYDYFSTVFVVFVFLIFLVFVWGIRRLRGELENNLKINFFRLVKAALPKITLGAAILISLFSYFLFSVKASPISSEQASSASLEQGSFPISFENFQSFILKPNEKIIGIFAPDFSFQKPLQTVFSGFLEKQISEKVPDFQNLSASAKKNILDLAVQREFTDGLDKFFGYKINAQDAIDKVVYNILTTKFDQLGKTAKNFIIIGIFVSLFLIIQSLFIPINWLFSFVLFIIYSFLLAINFAVIKMEPRSKEIIEI